MRVLVNGLSVGSLSGQHVVYGFLARVAAWTRYDHEFVILHDEASQLPETLIAENITSIPVSSKLRNWSRRIVWEFFELPKLIRQNNIDVLFNPSGALAPRISCQQVVLCQNPWCYVPSVHRGWSDAIKAKLQRTGYRRALQSSDLIIFISDFLSSLYRADNIGGPETHSEIAFVGINDSTFQAAKRLKDSTERDPLRIVSVSAMAPWKGAHTLIDAVNILRTEGLPATLRLVGPWPSVNYEREIREQIEQLKLNSAVEIIGKVSVEQLHHEYAQAQVFSLLSTCESFGIPAAEAQAFGTPAVVTTGCAMTEVCGAGALSCPPGDPVAAADALAWLLTSNSEWSLRSEESLSNVKKMSWDTTAQPCMKMFELESLHTYVDSNQEPVTA